MRGTEPEAPPDPSSAAWIPPVRRARECGARTRDGTPCRGPAVRGKRRCRMHGGAAGSGAQEGNRNAEKHGWWSAAAIAERERIGALIGDGAQLLREFTGGDDAGRA